MNCSYCKKEFTPTNNRNIYCKPGCKVMACRNRPKKTAISETQLQVLFKAIWDKLEGLPAATQQVGNLAAQNPSTATFQQPQYVPQRTPHDWVNEKREMEDPQEYQKWIKRLDADPYLTAKQKTMIKMA